MSKTKSKKLLFIHSNRFYRSGKDVFSGGSFPAYIWDNYLPNFGSITVIGRNSNDLKDKVMLSSGNPNVQFYLLDSFPPIWKAFCYFFSCAKRIKKVMNENDVIIVRLPSILGIIGGYIAYKNKKPFIVEQVGNARESLSSHKSKLSKLVGPLIHYSNKYIVKKAKYVIYVTEKKLQKDYPTQGKTVAISNVVLPYILSKEAIDLERFFNEKIKIALVGGFEAKYKGQDILLKAINTLPPSVKECIELFFIGTGDYSWVIDLSKELKLDKHISFIGTKKAGKEVFDLLSQMSLYIQPSLTEGMPRGMLEAMSVGCPVLASRVGGIPDLIDEKYLHTPRDFEYLSNQIKELFLNRQLLVESSYISIDKAKKFQKERLAAKRYLFLQQAIQESSFI